MVNVASVPIGERTVGPGEPVYVVAELGINHSGDLDVAKRLIAAAAGAGVDAVKLQTYTTESRVPPDSPIFDVLKRSELDHSAHEHLRDVARDHGVELFSTPFDDDAVALLASLDVPAFKIASFDIVNLQLIDRVAREGRTLIVSRGMASEEESDQALATIASHDVGRILLHCVSAYPLRDRDANLAILDSLMARYEVPIGYSDHTVGNAAALVAAARGARLIEKHFTLDREAEGPDHALSADPSQMGELCSRIREVDEILGTPEIRRLEVEEDIVPYRRATSLP